MNTTMSQEAASRTNPSMWLTNINHFFHLPNPRIFTLFVISSTATFSLGIAMIIQWALYGQHHPGFHWMVYCASAITSLPILVWVIFLLFAIRFNHPLQSSDLTKPQQSENGHQHTDTEAAAVRDELAMVQIETQPSGLTEEQPVCKSLIPVTEPRIIIDAKQALKRTLSLPLSHGPIDYSNCKRTTSLKH